MRRVLPQSEAWENVAKNNLSKEKSILYRMDGLLDTLTSILSSPFLIFILVIVAIAFSIISLVFILTLARKMSRIVTSIQTPPSSTPVAPASPSASTAKAIQKTAPAEVVRIAGGLESLEEISTALAVNSVFLFNLAGMSIEAYNVKEEDKLAAILADIVATLRKSGFPTEIINIKDSVQGYILSVTQVGEMEVFALLLGGPDTVIDVEEARQLLKDYVTSIIKKSG